ncbi:MAG: squalene/phytoene synthase family protein [Legionellales bacterium]|nr:squalene/phytoene synthase family protein [Legionellales bacterium]
MNELKAGSNLYYSLLFTKPPYKALLTALHSWWQEVNNILFTVSDPGVARVKLQWWRDEISRLFHQQAQHPLTQRLQTAAHDLSCDDFLAIINGVQFFLDHPQFSDRQTVQDYCEFTWGNLIRLHLALLKKDEKMCPWINELAVILGKTDLFLQLGYYLRRGYCFIPSQDIQAFAIDDNQLQQCQWHPAFQSYATQWHQAIQQQYFKIRENITAVTVGYELLIFTQLLLSTFQEVAKTHYSILNATLELTPLRKLWIAWRVSLR